ncbi:MAG: hypothetical protein L0229_19940 [Blastocatellia bacterium]|nr:hypothetical protein [Blastocatellia bacterium]
MNSIAAFINTHLGSAGRRQRASSRLTLALAAWMSIGVFPSEALGQTESGPTGVKAFEHMAEYLTRGTGQWRAAAPPRNGGPDALGLWFERGARGKLLELTVVMYYGNEVRVGSKSYWFWHPGRREIVYQEVLPNGGIRMGTTHFTDARTFITLTNAIGPDGKTAPNRGENVILSENEHRTTAYARDAAGKWVEQLALTWVRGSEPARNGAKTQGR